MNEQQQGDRALGAKVIFRASLTRVRALYVLIWVLATGTAPVASHASSTQSMTAPGPSFSCEAATNTIERAICGDAALAGRDRTMATLFPAAQAGIFSQGGSRQQALQRQWLKTRNKQCAESPTSSCLTQMYDERLKELAVAALFNAPDAALSELNRQDPDSAALYEAILRYATIEDPAERARVVGKLIEPAFDEIHGKPWADPLSDVKDARNAASSDKNFAAFLDVASINNYALTMPCAALMRRPGLIDALDAIYGGAIDGQLIRSDCEAATPGLDATDALTRAVMRVQSFCSGTIRFSLGREFDKTLVSVRLHRTDLWKAQSIDMNPGAQSGSEDDATGGEDEATFVARHRALIHNATEELTKYYSGRFAVPAAVADKQARDAVNEIISGAYDLCERDGG